jgi:hypothetical protein
MLRVSRTANLFIVLKASASAGNRYWAKLAAYSLKVFNQLNVYGIKAAATFTGKFQSTKVL